MHLSDLILEVQNTLDLLLSLCSNLFVTVADNAVQGKQLLCQILVQHATVVLVSTERKTNRVQKIVLQRNRLPVRHDNLQQQLLPLALQTLVVPFHLRYRLGHLVDSCDGFVILFLRQLSFFLAHVRLLYSNRRLGNKK